VRVEPYLVFNGQCREAFTRYQEVVGGTLETMMTHGESPVAEHVPAANRDLILHACLRVGETRLMGSDSPPEMFAQPQGTYVSLQVDDSAEAERIYRALSDGGTVTMPFEKTFWASGGFAMFTDRFGTPWMINCEAAA
jgi:PhnB protein